VADGKLGEVEKNRAKVEEMTKSYVPHPVTDSVADVNSLTPDTVDLIVLPEMALSGYMFSTPTSILPYLEPTTAGPTTKLAQALAKRLKCHVVAGYPEALASARLPGSSSSSGEGEGSLGEAGPKEMKALEGEGTGVGYNSAVIVGPSGEVVGNYRKSFRFETDKNWAREGASPCTDMEREMG
jgi:protein N-terminal amidase